MMWLARPRLMAVMAVALTLGTVEVAVHGHQGESPPPSDGQALAREELALVDQALDMMHRLADNRRIDPADPSFFLWGRRKIETLRKTGVAKGEVVAALEKYIERLKRDEVLAVARKERALGTDLEVYEVRFRRMEAEGWLIEEKAR